MASIQKKRGKYGVTWRDLSGKQKWRTCPNHATAKRLRVEVEAALALGRDWEPDRPGEATRLREVLEKFIEVRAPDLAPKTLIRYAQALDLAMEQAELVHGVNPSVRVLSQPYLEDFYTWLGRAGGGRHQKTRSRATCIKLLQALQLAWAWAAKSGRWPDIPLPRPLEKKKPPRRTVVAPSYEEWDSMMASLRVSCERYQGRVPEGVARDWPYRLAMLCRFTGMRRLAGLQLTGAHIDLNRGAINIPGELTKGGYGGRIIPLHDDLAKAVEKWDVGPGSLVMPPALELTGRGHVDRTFRRAWMRASVGRDRWAGQPIHSARKMIRTHLVIEGYQPDVIDTLLAHAPPGTGGRSYLDQLRLWEPLVEAVGKIPSLRENL